MEKNPLYARINELEEVVAAQERTFKFLQEGNTREIVRLQKENAGLLQGSDSAKRASAASVELVSHALRKEDQLLTERDTLKESKERYFELLKRASKLFGDEECRYDHHGACQEHGLEQDCTVQLIREEIRKSEE